MNNSNSTTTVRRCTRCSVVAPPTKGGLLPGKQGHVVAALLLAVLAYFWVRYVSTLDDGTYWQRQALGRAEIASFVLGLPGVLLLVFKVPRCSSCGSKELAVADVPTSEKGGLKS